MPSNETALIIRLRESVTQLRKDHARTKRMMRAHSNNLNKIGRGIGTQLATYFGGAVILGAIGKGISSLAGFEKQMSKVRAVSSATEKDFRRLQANALDLGRTTKFTATEVAELQVALAKLGFTPQKILDSADAVRKLATVADSELAPAAATMAGTLNSFNLEATESERVANVMAESFSKSALDLEKFTVATANSGAVANALGVTLEQNTARIAALVDANIDASKAGTDLRKIYSELNKTGMSFNEAMEFIRLSTNKAKEAQKLFGQRAFGAALILAEQTDKVHGLTKELRDSNEELEAMADVMEDNLATSFEKLTSAIDGVIQKGGALRSAMRGVVDFFTTAINALAGNLPSYEEELISTFTKAGKAISSSFKDNEEDLVRINNKIQEYQHGLSVATGRLNAFAKENVTNGKVTASNALEFRDLRDEVIRYGVTLSELQGKQIKINDALAIEEEEAAKVKKELEGVRVAMAGIQAAGDLSDSLDISSIGGLTAPEPVNPMPLDNEAMQAGIEEALFGIRVFRERTLEEMNALGAQMDEIMKGTIVAGFTSLGESIGNGSSLKDAFGSIFSVIGDGLKSMGTAMIAAGISLDVFKKALQSGNGPLLIAGGVALVAAGAAVKSATTSAGNNIGSGGSSGGRSGGNLQADQTGRTIRLEGSLESRIEGKDIVVSYDLAKDLNSRDIA